ncbi:Bcr/CflA family efflux MFS transporter [Ilumatobacter coccineus]|nr:Bcr/CflA family efflux MFS transporter [Ilumatobacter coccineus]
MVEHDQIVCLCHSCKLLKPVVMARTRRYGAAVNGSTTQRTERSVIAFLAFIGILMAFGVDAALPAFDELSESFDLEARNLSPAITGTVYFVGMALGQVVYGVLGDRFGRRPILLIGIGVYALGALVSAIAPNLEVLLAARFVWGLGASAPTVLRMAIARDLFDGDRMARVVSTVAAVFLLGPIIVPIAGEGILLVGSWRLVFGAALVLASIAFVWTLRFGETLADEHRRTLRFGPFVEALEAVVRTSSTRWSILSMAFFTGSFFVWLGSAQVILDQVYDRDSQFTIFFGLSGVGMAIALMSNGRLIDRFGIRYLAVRASVAFVVVAAIGTIAAVAADGVPSLWVWFGWACVANALNMILGPMSSAIAMEPMGDKAGMASALLGLTQLGGGAILAAIVDARIDATVTPMVVGALVYGAAGLGCMVLAVRSPVTD